MASGVSAPVSSSSAAAGLGQAGRGRVALARPQAELAGEEAARVLEAGTSEPAEELLGAVADEEGTEGGAERELSDRHVIGLPGSVRAQALPEQDREVGHPGDEVADRAGHEPGRETLAGRTGLTLSSAADGHERRQHERDRASRVARARRGRGRAGGDREAHRAVREGARPPAARARVPARQGARRRSSSSASAARRSSTRPSATTCPPGTRRRSTTRASPRSATRTSTSASCPSEGQPLTFSIEIGVRPKATLGEYKGLEVEQAVRRGRGRGDRRGDRAAARAQRPPRDRRARRREGRLRGDGLRRLDRRRAVRRRRGRATR